MKKLILIFSVLILVIGLNSFAAIKFYESNKITIYNGIDSPILVKLYDLDNTVLTAIEIAAITKVEIKYIPASGETVETANSVDYAAGFDLVTYKANGVILLSLGLHGFTVGRDSEAQLLIYNSTFTSGRVVDVFDMKVSDDVDGTPTVTPLI